MQSSVVRNYNPFRYRGYFYDYETGLYYLQSRYYNPATGRFLNADGYINANGDLIGFNMYAYCSNNPVMGYDPTGYFTSSLTTPFSDKNSISQIDGVRSSCGGGLWLPLPHRINFSAVIDSIVSVISQPFVWIASCFTTDVQAKENTAIEKSNGETKKDRNHFVYVLKDATGTVQYVGRTKNILKRKAAHAANPYRSELEMEVIGFGLTLTEARALEQSAMAYYHTINTANKMNNQINSISPRYWDLFKEVARGTLEYSWNQMTNEILYWVGS